MTAGQIAHALNGRKSGSGWMAKCPSHPDRTASLHISAGRDGTPLVFDHGGCSQQEVIAALRDRGLWPERERIEYSPAERRAWAEDMRASRWWALAARALVDEYLDQAHACDAIRADLTRLAATLRDDRSALAEFRAWREHSPELTAAMVAAGRRLERTQVRALAVFIAEQVA